MAADAPSPAPPPTPLARRPRPRPRPRPPQPPPRAGDDDTLYLIDAMGLVYRSYHALANVTLSSRALPDTRAVYGFTIILQSLLAQYARGARVAVVFEGRPDGPGPPEVDFRTASFPEYKANRASAPDGVRLAVPWVKRIVEALGCAVVEVGCFEADDVIGTLVARRREEDGGGRCVVVSSDKDFRQLLSAGVEEGGGGGRRRGVVEILRPVNRAKGSGSSYERVDEAAFRREFGGIPPRAYVDVLALLGDKADNVPGVPGIGAKTAPKLVARYGGLEELLDAVACAGGQALPGVTKRLVGLVGENAELARISRRLVTIKEDVVMPCLDWSDFHRKPVDERDVDELCRLLEFQPSVRNQMLAVDGDVNLGFASQSSSAIPSHQSIVDGVVAVEGGEQHADDAAFESNVSELAIENEFVELSLASPEDEEAVASAVVAIGQLCRSGTEYAPFLGIAPVRSRADVLEGIAFSARPGTAWYFALNGEQALPHELILLLQDEAVEKRGWALKECTKLLRQFGLKGCMFDMGIACDLLWSGQSMTDFAFVSRYLGSQTAERGALFSGSSKTVGLPTTPASALAAADIAARLGHVIHQELDAARLLFLAYEVEFPLVPVLAKMEAIGVPFSSSGLEVIKEQVDRELSGLEDQLMSLVPTTLLSSGRAGDDCDDADLLLDGANHEKETAKGVERKGKKAKTFSLTSRDDIAKLLFETWEIPVKFKTPTGKATTDKRTLVTIAQKAELPEEQRAFASLMLKHREASKLASTYTRSLASSLSPLGRIHSTFLQGASASGRLSTSSPNLQAIPVRSSLGRSIRSTVSAGRGFSIVTADYSQIELRILAAFSKDFAMMEAFRTSQDIHTAVASRIFNTDSPTAAQRSRAKAVSFGIPYGISAYGLSLQLSISGSDARVLIEDFFKAFPGVKRLTEELVDCAREVGYAESLGGRRLYLPLLSRGGTMERRAAERVAVNMPIQATQADMIKAAMVAVARRLEGIGNGDSALVLQVHDELVLEAANGYVDEVVHCVCEEMCRALKLPGGVEVVVNVGAGPTWYDAAANASRYEIKRGRVESSSRAATYAS